MKFLVLGASLRKDSLNVKLSHVIENILKQEGHHVSSVSFLSLDVPLYNEDVQNVGFPEGVKKYGELLQEADGWIICSPEYNFSVPGTVKNFIDWLSRLKPNPFSGKQIFLASASPGLVGGNRGLWHLRVPLEACKGFVYPTMFSIPKAHEAFDEKGHLKDASTLDRLALAIKDFNSHVERNLRSS